MAAEGFSRTFVDNSETGFVAASASADWFVLLFKRRRQLRGSFNLGDDNLRSSARLEASALLGYGRGGEGEGRLLEVVPCVGVKGVARGTGEGLRWATERGDRAKWETRRRL